MAKQEIKLTLKRPLPYQDLLQDLEALGYRRVPMVLEPGEVSVRGSIVDVFSPNHSHPIRLEYDGDAFDRFGTFDLTTQSFISPLKNSVLHPYKKDENAHFISSDYDGVDMSLISTIREDDYVVHENYGIGIYAGLHHMRFGKREGEYALLRYKGKDKLYVPLEQVHLLHRYSAGDTKPRVNSLHDGSWKRTKQSAKRVVRELAEEIYTVVKERHAQKGFQFQEDTESQILFEKAFPFKETEDQLRVVEEIKRDMEKPIPMDRVVCGDVGFGKTELMLRAAFKAVENYKQVAILVPTTILADQHYRTFKARFDPFGYKVGVLSRFQTPAQLKKTLKALQEEKVSVVIGTHRLLQKDVQFNDLGLLIVDEEQRFGVGHKEKIKQIKINVDVLSISATPIPRTLYMALTGARQFSTLKTPPHTRKPILTTITEYQPNLVKKVIMAELKRGGQVYYLYNRVDTIAHKLATLQDLLPKKRFALIHGRLSAKQIDHHMQAFKDKKIDVLVSTSIIENGLDIPSVNTIVIDKAELLGLSQIHQIKGRVGRSTVQGYAYLLYQQESLLTDKAKKRFQAIKEYVTLGAGYQLAMKDLEIRGAGTLLGDRQHGHMTAVGFELYCKLLEDAVKKDDKVEAQRPAIMINPELNAFIPETYVENPRERLALYKRIMTMRQKHQIEELLWELRDRYGDCPDIVETLLLAVKAQLS